MKKHALLNAITFSLILLFVYAGLTKWIGVEQFETDLNNQPFSRQFTPYLLVIIPAVELLTAAGLLFDKTRLLAFYVSVVLMGVFSLYTLLVILRLFRHMPCSCGGIIRKLTWNQHMLLNLFFLAASLAGLDIEKKSRLAN